MDHDVVRDCMITESTDKKKKKKKKKKKNIYSSSESRRKQNVNNRHLVNESALVS